jgi:hypothetical protein
MRRSHEPDDSRNIIVLLDDLRDALGGLLILRHKGRLLDQIARRVAAHGKFGKDDQARTGGGGAATKVYDSRGIPAEVTNGRIDLPQRNLHSLSLIDAAMYQGDAALNQG